MWTVQGAPASGILSRLEGGEQIGAVAFDYRGGNACVHPNLYKIGHSLERHELPANRFLRWLLVRALKRGLGPFEWAYQVNYGGSCSASGETTRAAAVARCKRWIDEKATASSDRPAA